MKRNVKDTRDELKLIIRGCSNFVRILITLSANIFEKKATSLLSAEWINDHRRDIIIVKARN